MNISVQANGFTMAALLKRRSVMFEGIESLEAEKLDKITYEEVFLIVRTSEDDEVVLGELDKGFAELEEALRAELKSFPTEWKARAEEAPCGTRVEVWRKVPS